MAKKKTRGNKSKRGYYATPSRIDPLEKAKQILKETEEIHGKKEVKAAVDVLTKMGMDCYFAEMLMN